MATAVPLPQLLTLSQAGLAGSAIEEGMTRKDALEITLKLDGGAMIAIVQETDEEFHPGDKVRIVENGETSRVTH